MSLIKCPSCGSPNVEQIDVDKYQCSYCGKTFSQSQNAPTEKVINIHGYTQWFAVNPDILIKVDDQPIDKVGKDGVVKIKVDKPCQLKFECSLRSTTINVDPAVDTDVYLSFDRISGSLLANTQADDENTEIDKPNMTLDIVSLLFPIVGIILYFIKKEEYPNSAKAYLTCAILGFAIGLIYFIL